MSTYRAILSALLSASALFALASCSTTCGDPDVCAQPTPAFQHMSDAEVTTMTEKLDGLAGL